MAIEKHEVDYSEGIEPDQWVGERIMIDTRAQAWLDERKEEFLRNGGSITVLPAMPTPTVNPAFAWEKVPRHG